jgi:F-type H+-transporting ATPase subunit epsilon
MGVLEMHAALVTSLQAGELRYRKDGEVYELAVGGGFAEVTQEKVSVLTDTALGEDEIDEAAVEAAIKSAEDALHGLKHDENAEEIAHLQAMIAQSMAKLKLKRKRRNI